MISDIKAFSDYGTIVNVCLCLLHAYPEWSDKDPGWYFTLSTIFHFHAQSIVMRDRETQRSHGFGFISYNTEAEAHAAAASLSLTK